MLSLQTLTVLRSAHTNTQEVIQIHIHICVVVGFQSGLFWVFVAQKPLKKTWANATSMYHVGNIGASERHWTTVPFTATACGLGSCVKQAHWTKLPSCTKANIADVKFFKKLQHQDLRWLIHLWIFINVSKASDTIDVCMGCLLVQEVFIGQTSA